MKDKHKFTKAPYRGESGHTEHLWKIRNTRFLSSPTADSFAHLQPEPVACLHKSRCGAKCRRKGGQEVIFLLRLEPTNKLSLFPCFFRAIYGCFESIQPRNQWGFLSSAQDCCSMLGTRVEKKKNAGCKMTEKWRKTWFSRLHLSNTFALPCVALLM